MVRLISFLVFHFTCMSVSGQIQIIIDSLPIKTPDKDTIFIASSLNNWNPHDVNYAFIKGDSSKCSITLNNLNNPFEYKLCRGDWKKVETNSDGSEIKNRVYKPGQGSAVLIKVSGWKDMFPQKPKVSSASKNVSFMSSNIEIPKLDRRRTIRMYFPPNYSSGKRFPVIYMHDGQNLFDDATSFAGEWKVDETLDSLYQFQGFTCMVVGIYNSEKYRMSEYLPWKNDSLGLIAEGEEYAHFIVKTLKPFVDSHYRTLPDRDNTAIMGSSMGGLISLYIALEYPDVFGKVGVFSPSFWISPKSFEQIDKFKMKKNQKIYLLAGELEGEGTVKDVLNAEEKLKKVGFDDSLLKTKIDSLGAHNELFWSKEFGNALKFLFKL